MVKIRFKYLCILVFILASSCSKEAKIYTIDGNIFGTTWSVRLSSEREINKERLKESITSRLQAINDIMSTWQPDSELSLFNSHLSGDWYPASQDLGLVIRKAKEIHEASFGAFDPTLGPLIKLWGFSSNHKIKKIPDPVAIEVAKSRIGMESIEVSDDNKRIRKSKSIIVDLSAIAKGYAVDQIADLLLNSNHENFLVEIGGEIRIKGSKNSKPWTIGIETPDANSRAIHTKIKVGDIGIATSGDYRNFFEEDGQRYSHIIDPRTGYPVRNKLASVTVLAADSMIADAYATAFMVLGDEQALDIAKQQNLAVYMLVADGDGFKAVYSDNFASYLETAKKP